MLEGARDRHQRFERGQRGKHEQRNQRTGLAVAADSGRGEPQHQSDRQATGQNHQRLCHATQRSLLPLAALPALLGGIQTGTKAFNGTEHHQLGLALQPGGQIGTVLTAQCGQLTANRLTCTIKHRWHQQQ
ncbi:hypothetical protein D3C80_1687930 [compost metagenome]